MTISIGPTVQMISSFRLPKYGGGSSEPGRCRKRIRLIPTMPTTIARMTPQMASTTANRLDIAAACGEAGSKIRMTQLQ